MRPLWITSTRTIPNISDITKKFKFAYWPVGNYDGKMKSLRTFTVPANDIYDAKLIFGLVVPHYAIYEVTELT